MADANQNAAGRGHTYRAMFSGGCHDLFLAFAPDASLDQVFAATCLDTGDRLEVKGWLYTVEADADDDDEDDGQPDEAAEWADYDIDC